MKRPRSEDIVFRKMEFFRPIRTDTRCIIQARQDFTSWEGRGEGYYVDPNPLDDKVICYIHGGVEGFPNTLA